MGGRSMRTNQWHSPATVWGTLAILASLAAPVTAQDWARLRRGAEKTIFFRAAVPLQSFREITFIESLKQLGPLHINNYEASSTQQVGGGITRNLAPGLTPEEIAVVKNASRGRRMAVYSIPSIGSEEPAARALFQ